MTPVTFPLADLPFLAGWNVLETMDMLDWVTASFMSEPLKQHICEMQRKKHIFQIDFHGEKVKLVILKTAESKDGIQFNVSKKNNLYELRFGEGSSSYQRPWKVWVARLMEIYKCQAVILSIIEQKDSFGVDDIVGLFEQTEIVSLRVVDSPEVYGRKILEAHNYVGTILLTKKPEVEDIVFRGMLSNNAHKDICFTFYCCYRDLIAIRAEKIELGRIRMTDEEINSLLEEFLTGWNPELKKMLLKIPRVDREFNPAILRNLEHELVEENEGYFDFPLSFTKKFIIKKDGEAKATVEFNRYGGIFDCVLAVEN